MRKKHIRAWVLIAVTFLIPAAVAQQQPSFEAVLSGRNVFGCVILTFYTPVLEWVSPDRVEDNTAVHMIASAVGQPVFALRSGQIVTLQPDGTHATFATAPSDSFSLAVATTGRVFVVGSGPTLTVFSPAGVQEAAYPLPGSAFSDVLAVASDGCTIYYQNASSISRIDGCTGAVLSNFTAIPALTQLNDIYPLRTGEVLIALGDDVVLYDAAGNVIRTIADIADYGFDPDQFEALQVATTTDEQVLYIAIGDACFNEAFLLRALIRDDARELSRRQIQLNDINGLVVGTASTLDAPTASETALLFLAIALAFGGVFLLRR